MQHFKPYFSITVEESEVHNFGLVVDINNVVIINILTNCEMGLSLNVIKLNK